MICLLIIDFFLWKSLIFTLWVLVKSAHILSLPFPVGPLNTSLPNFLFSIPSHNTLSPNFAAHMWTGVGSLTGTWTPYQCLPALKKSSPPSFRYLSTANSSPAREASRAPLLPKLDILSGRQAQLLWAQQVMTSPEASISPYFTCSSGSYILSAPSSLMLPEAWGVVINVLYVAENPQSLILSHLNSYTSALATTLWNKNLLQLKSRTNLLTTVAKGKALTISL